MFSIDPMATVLRNTSIDRIMYSIDYPFATFTEGLGFLKELQASRMVDEEQMAKIAYKNAEGLLGIKVPLCLLTARGLSCSEYRQGSPWASARMSARVNSFIAGSYLSIELLCVHQLVHLALHRKPPD